MDFRHLTYFVAVAEELHFRRAAERLHVVQPALSQQIARLETELGVQLLARTKRQVQLTDAGRVFLADARAMLAYRERAVASARQAAAGQVGRLDVGFVGPATYSVLPTVVRTFRGQHPDVVLNLYEHTTAKQLEMLAAGELGVGIVRMPTDDDRFQFERIMTEPICAVLPEEHPLSGRDTIRLSELADEGFVVVPRSLEPVMFDRIISLCARAGFSPRVVQEALQVHAIIGLVATGLGVALVPWSMCTLRRSDVVYKRLEPPVTATVETGVVWRTGDESPVITRFLNVVRGLSF
jgi:DNA-binding transcriptional LysR family regulator